MTTILHSLSGIQFVKQVEKITQYGGFALVKGETSIYSVGGEYDGDYGVLLSAFPEHIDTDSFLACTSPLSTIGFVYTNNVMESLSYMKAKYNENDISIPDHGSFLLHQLLTHCLAVYPSGRAWHFEMIDFQWASLISLVI